jgi:hypothetical protein
VLAHGANGRKGVDSAKDRGSEILAQVTQTHVSGIKKHFLERLSNKHLEQALARYERKENIVMAGRIGARLAELKPSETATERA